MNEETTTHPDYANHPQLAIKKEDSFLAYYFSAQVGNLFVRLFRHTPITPNMVSFISLALGILAAHFYSRGDWTSLIVGALTHHLSFILDCTDGQLARVTNKKSQFGAWMDFHSDRIKDFCLLLGMSWGVYAQTGQVWILVVGFLAISLQMTRNMTEMYRQIFTWSTQGKAADKVATIKTPSTQFLLTMKSSLLFKIAERVLLMTLFAFLNLASFGLIVYAVLALFYAIGSGFLNYKSFRQYDRKSTRGAVQ